MYNSIILKFQFAAKQCEFYDFFKSNVYTFESNIYDLMTFGIRLLKKGINIKYWEGYFSFHKTKYTNPINIDFMWSFNETMLLYSGEVVLQLIYKVRKG